VHSDMGNFWAGEFPAVSVSAEEARSTTGLIC
jgi:hypothetical protein